MSVTLKLYNYNSDKKRVDKSLFLNYEITVTGDFDGPVDLTNLSVKLDLSSITFSSSLTILDYNYLYCTEFNRYYYIGNITFITSDIVILPCTLDPLYSNKSKILNMTAFVSRTQKLSFIDDTIEDNLQPYTSNVITTYLNPSTIYQTSILGNRKTKSFIFSALNTNSNNTVTMGDTSPFISDSLYNTDKAVFCMDYNAYSYILQDIYNNHSNDIQYIKSMYQIPFSLFTSAGATQWTGVPINNYTIEVYNNIASYVYEYNVSSIITKKIESVKFSITETFDNLNADYYLYVPFADFIKVNINEINNKKISLYFNLNLITTESSYIIYDEDNAKILYSGSCDIAKRVNLSNEDIEKYNQRQQANAINTGLGVLSSTLSIGLGVASSNPIALGGGAISLGSTVAKGLQQAQFDKPEGHIEKTSVSLGWYLPKNMYLKQVKREMKGTVNIGLYGRPCNQVTTLSNLTGTTLLSDYFLSNFSLTEDEEILLRQALSEYIILP